MPGACAHAQGGAQSFTKMDAKMNKALMSNREW